MVHLLKRVHGTMTSWLKALMFVSIFLYTTGRGIQWIRDVLVPYLMRISTCSYRDHHHQRQASFLSSSSSSSSHEGNQSSSSSSSSEYNHNNSNTYDHGQHTTQQKEVNVETPSELLSSKVIEYFQLEIPVPYINLKSLFSNDNVLPSNDPFIMNQFTSDFLNNIAKRMDFLHKNYVRYLNKLASSNDDDDGMNASNQQEDLSSSNTSTLPTATPTMDRNNTQRTSLQKRMYPIVFRNKFSLAKDLLLRDLHDSIEKCQLKTEMYRQQVKAISRFIPPSFFLNDPSFAPYYWVLTDVDYKLMPPFLRNYVLYSSSLVASMYGGPFYSPFMGFDESGVMPLGSQQQTSMMTSSSITSISNNRHGETSIPSYIRDRIRYEWELFIRQNKSILHRFDFLYNAFLSRNGLCVTNKDDESRYRKEFTEQCFKLLKSRRKVALRKIKTIRLKQIRPSEREKSQLRTQYTKLKQLELLP
ncbi:hypothetical protein FDP41_007644 [Naegleria fowleri]|uniref:Uncharacterized protein n=1 Tax=Naegleria fowleri TaxID=5763 RepID=A0A6A5CEI5_NAEFO|nr:uncharacterized protein FDP41_007644 [Naegleria fowleri]KAF0983729.1 hypothetical protein FDP41_007644 [Naegleria fowleri]CAG4716844.1 unnamed protein product [Naegleria fowleri]